MATMKLITSKHTSTLDCWKPERRGNGQRCGNVAVRPVRGSKPWKTWAIFVRDSRGKWKRFRPDTRGWDYGSARQAKCGVASTWRWQRRKAETAT